MPGSDRTMKGGAEIMITVTADALENIGQFVQPTEQPIITSAY